MNRKLIYIAVLCTFFACNEKYDFNVENEKEGIVVEASISDLSFMESLQFPSEGRYFKVRLTKTTKVDNVRDEKIIGAQVSLIDENGERYTYTEAKEEPGFYYLRDEFFEARPNLGYKLEISLATGQRFSSSWEHLPEVKSEMGDIHFDEIRKDIYKWEAGERVIKNVRAINVKTKVAGSGLEQKRFFRWTFEPIWVYVSALAARDSPVRYCWVTSPFVLNEIVLNEDKGKGEYDQELFDLETTGNELIYHYYSAIIHQESISEGYYEFWLDFEEQKNKGGLYDKPPYGLPTNYIAENSDWTVNGYFAVVSESAVRWEFTKDQLSYPVENNLKEICEEITDGSDQCVICTVYNIGTPKAQPPLWWTRETVEPFNVKY